MPVTKNENKKSPNEALDRQRILQVIKKIRECRHALQLESLILMDKLKELKSGGEKKECGKAEETTESAMALKIMQKPLDVKRLMETAEEDDDLMFPQCNTEMLNLNVGVNNNETNKANVESDDEGGEEHEDDDDSDDDPDNYIVDISMFMNGKY
ncbi:hypothetical protein ACJJTC_013313 [Scirpophaga incertulas]